jgi:hypothetical protein
MSFLSKIFPTQSEVQAQQQAQVPVAQAPEPAPVQQPTQQQDPLDTLWDTTPNSNAASNALDFNIDPVKLAEIAGKLDYSQVITPELRQQLAAGGDDAVAATVDIINQVQRLGYQQNAMATTKLIEAAVRSTEASLDDRISKRLKLAGLDESLSESHPALSDPKFAPVVGAIKQQIVTKFPNASKADIQKMTVSYLENMSASLNPGMAERANSNNSNKPNFTQPEQDWFSWAELDV